MVVIDAAVSGDEPVIDDTSELDRLDWLWLGLGLGDIDTGRVDLFDKVASVRRIRISRANPILAEVSGKVGAAVKV